MESIHKRIRRLREAKGLTQEALAKLVGVRYQSVQEWEREDGTAPSRKHQANVARVLGVSPAELMHHYERAENRVEQLSASYGVSDEALEIARGWSELPPVCQDHVRRQIELLLGRVVDDSGRRKAAQPDAEIRPGALKLSARKKPRRGVR